MPIATADRPILGTYLRILHTRIRVNWTNLLQQLHFYYTMRISSIHLYHGKTAHVSLLESCVLIQNRLAKAYITAKRARLPQHRQLVFFLTCRSQVRLP